MAENKVRFLRGTAAEYADTVKDEDAFYYTTDDEKFYVGSKEITGGGITVDSELSDTSIHPVQNKAIKTAIDEKADKTTATSDTDGLMSASDKTKLDNADDTYALKSKYGDTTIDVGRKAETEVGRYSTAEGQSTTANGFCSHAEGCTTEANGKASHAEGRNTTAFGDYSHAEGYNTIANNEAESASGKYNVSNSDTLFSVGDGTADDARHNAFEITTTGGKLHDKDIATTNNISNPNLLINPDFRINQRSITGTFSETGKYFVDRWKLVSGTVTINSDGTLTLNGSICQTLENETGSNVTASVSSGTAVYDDTNNRVTITGDGHIISWAKLEIGSTATPFSPSDPTTELLKCQRYYSRITTDRKVFGSGFAVNTSTTNIFIAMPHMRTNPDISFTNLALVGYNHVTSGTSAAVSGITNIAAIPNGVSLQMVGSDLTAGQVYMPIILTDGYIEFDAEIY